MSSHRILAFSSSRVGDGAYLESALPVISAFLGHKPLLIAFVPFAAAEITDIAYTAAVRAGLQSLPHTIETVNAGNANELITKAEVIMVGGGNTFKLLHDLYKNDLLNLIREKVNAGTPYIGWSAGSNILGPGIGTTNDMPIIEPESFRALGLFRFQINPHYSNYKPAGHNGETRDQRLQEFTVMNPTLPVFALPEGTALKQENGRLEFIGIAPGYLFTPDKKQEIPASSDISFLL